MRLAWWLGAGLALAACGGEGGRAPAPLAVAVEGPVSASTPAFVAEPALGERARAVAVESAAAWGAGPEALDGWSITFAQAAFACGDVEHASGCTRHAAREIRVLAFGAACPEATALPHEAGHVVLGDPRHRDSRWCDRAFWRALRDRLAATAPPGCSLDGFVERSLGGCAEPERHDEHEEHDG